MASTPRARLGTISIETILVNLRLDSICYPPYILYDTLYDTLYMLCIIHFTRTIAFLPTCGADKGAEDLQDRLSRLAKARMT
jgi:hypothetical protein